jgi:hypothetical protein
MSGMTWPVFLMFFTFNKMQSTIKICGKKDYICMQLLTNQKIIA